MATVLSHPSTRLSQAQIPEDDFLRMRRENLSRWPTGAEVDIDEAVALHESLPTHKRLSWVMREAVRTGRCLTQSRGGFGTLALQKELMQTLDRSGLADIVPTTTDSYTRNEQFELAQQGIEASEKAGRSMLNGFPIVNYGPRAARELIECIDKPGIVLAGTSMPKFSSEVAFAAGYSGYLGSGIAYTVSYIKELSIEEGIRNYQYLDRLAAYYMERGVELHRRQPGFLTGTNVPPCIMISICVLDCLLAAGQGVRNYGLELGQTVHMTQDAAAIQVCRKLCQEYLANAGYRDVFTPITSLQWIGAWPYDESQASAMIALGGAVAAVGGAASVTTKSVQEAFGVPTPQSNAEGLRIARMGVYLARNLRLDGLPEFEREKSLIECAARAIVDKVLEMGEGDAAIGTVRAFEAGVLDIPWSPNRHVRNQLLTARDADGYLRILDPGLMPIPKEVLEAHEAGLRRRASRDGIEYGVDLAVDSVYELTEELAKLIPDHRALVRAAN